jgi:uncharacterized protein YigA (DUF484 family)
MDVWNVADAEADRRAAGERREELREVFADLALRAQINRDTFARLIEGQLSLADAAETLEHANRGRPGWAEKLRTEFPGATTDRDAHALWAVRWVQNSLEDDPSRQAEVGARLDRDYRAMRSPGASIRPGSGPPE